MAELLTGIEITGYRQFERFRMDGLRRVNLLVGKNNAGKTALLEAVQLLTSRPALGTIRSILDRRGEAETLSDKLDSFDRLRPSLRHLFPGHALPKTNSGLRIIGQGIKTSLDLSIEDRWADSPLQSLSSTQEAGDQYLLKIQEDDAYPYATPVGRKGTLPEKDNPNIEIEKFRFVPTSGMNRQEMARLFDLLVEEGRESDIVAALRLLDEGIESVHSRSSVHYPFSNEGSGILLGYKGRGRHPLGSAGEGMKRMLGLALALSNARGGTLLIDEIDTGLHHSVMGDLWRLVTTTARNLDIQVFATTHSLDCVRGIVAMGQEDPSLFEEIAVHTIDARRGQSVATAGERLDDAVQLEVELR